MKIDVSLQSPPKDSNKIKSFSFLVEARDILLKLHKISLASTRKLIKIAAGKKGLVAEIIHYKLHKRGKNSRKNKKIFKYIQLQVAKRHLPLLVLLEDEVRI